MKGALNDRFLLALLSVLLLAVLAFGYFLLEDRGSDFALGQALTKQQKTEVIGIAMNDSFVNNELRNAASVLYSTYYFKDVIGPAQFYETGPGLNRSRILPAVKFIIGDENMPGQNVLAFVDLKEKRVVHIGYVQRADKYGKLPIQTFENKSIVNTGYSYEQNLTDEQKADAVKIALDDKRVQDQLNGTNYSLNGIGMTQSGWSGPGYDYMEIYPSVSFMVGKVYEPGYMVMVLIDLNNKKVVNVMTHFRTPVPRELVENTSSDSTR